MRIVQEGRVVSPRVSAHAPGSASVLLLAAALVLSSAAPSMAAGPIEFKRIFGVSWARFSEPPNPVAIPEAGFSLGTQPGLVFGGGGVLPLTKYLSLDLNIQYLRKGTRVYHTFMSDPMGTSTYNFRALSLPFSIRFGPLPLHGSIPYILAGIEASYLLSHNVTYFGDGSDSGTAVKLASVIRHFDFAAILGGGFDIAFKTWVFFAEVRWYAGLVNLSQGVEGYPVIKTRTISLQIGFRTKHAPFSF
jgi:hypothetical protein